MNATEEYTDKTVNIDEIVGAGARVPAGRYVAKLIAVEPKESKAGKPMIEARYEIQEGNEAGSDILAFYSLSVSPPKKAGQKPFAPGIVEMKTAFAAVGAALPAGFAFPLDPHAAAKIFAKALGKKKLDIAVLEDKRKDETGEEKVQTRVKVLGLAKGAAAPQTETTAPQETLDDLI